MIDLIILIYLFIYNLLINRSLITILNKMQIHHFQLIKAMFRKTVVTSMVFTTFVGEIIKHEELHYLFMHFDCRFAYCAVFF